MPKFQELLNLFFEKAAITTIQQLEEHNVNNDDFVLCMVTEFKVVNTFKITQPHKEYFINTSVLLIEILWYILVQRNVY